MAEFKKIKNILAPKIPKPGAAFTKEARVGKTITGELPAEKLKLPKIKSQKAPKY
jgi:hypothetical protein